MPVTEAQRKKYAIFSDGSYPIWNKKSAINALRLRGHLRSKADRLYLIDRASKFAPDQAFKALVRDSKNRKV